MSVDQKTNNESGDQEGSPEEVHVDEQMAENLRQQLSEAMQPMIDDLRQTISQAIEQQYGAAGSEGEDAESQEDDGSLISRVVEAIKDFIQRLLEWIRETFDSLGDKVAEKIGSLAGQLVQKAVKSAF